MAKTMTVFIGKEELKVDECWACHKHIRRNLWELIVDWLFCESICLRRLICMPCYRKL